MFIKSTVKSRIPFTVHLMYTNDIYERASFARRVITAGKGFRNPTRNICIGRHPHTSKLSIHYVQPRILLSRGSVLFRCSGKRIFLLKGKISVQGALHNQSRCDENRQSGTRKKPRSKKGTSPGYWVTLMPIPSVNAYRRQVDGTTSGAHLQI